MCGIAGVRGADAEQRTLNMLPLMIHRGPDGEGVWAHNGVALGHRRLAINDLSEAGAQPMIDGNIAISVNGEIYNYPDLRAELEKAGCIFKTRSDSEVVLHAWKVWGYDCFIRFNGMFAISLYDIDRDVLVLARDRLGIKPLYYYQENNNGLVFASEVKALLAGLASAAPAIDPVGLAQYLTYQNNFGTRTLRQGVCMLPPSHLLIAAPNEIKLQSYWQLSFDEVDDSFDFTSVVTRYQDVFNAAVKRHLMSDVPVASYLSAGFDSASVANRASELGEPPVSFTGTFAEGGWYDETSMAKKMAQHNGSEHISAHISADDVPRMFDKLIYALDEPRMGMGALPQYCVAEKVAASHKVILTGHGGDELFSGYPVFKLVYLLSQLRQSPVAALKYLKQLRFSEMPHLIYFLTAGLRSSRYQQYLPVLQSTAAIKNGLKDTYYSEVRSVAPEQELLQLDGNANSASEVLYSHYLQAYLNGLLVVEDKLSMAHSLESRTPMLDNEMLGLSLSCPQALKMHNGQLKAVIKEAGKAWLPAELYAQPKRGFPTPFRFWLRGPLQGWFKDRLIGNDSALPVLFKAEWLQRIYKEYMFSSMRHFRPLDEIQSHRMWQLLSLESWLRQYNVS